MICKRFVRFFSDIYFGWLMVGVVTAVRVIGGGLHQYGFTVFFLPVTRDLGLTRAAMSLAFSLARAGAAIEAPLVGYLVDRFGPRPILVTAALCAGVGYILLSWVNGYLSFLLVYLGVISLAFTAGFVHSPMVVANSWFIRQRARAMITISAAVPIGGAILTPLLALAVEAWGWRWASFGAGFVFLSVALPLSLQVRRSPESIGLLPDGIHPAKPSLETGSVQEARAAGNAEADYTIGTAMRSRIFWIIVLSMTLRMTTFSTVSVHFVPIMVWKGLSQEQAAFLLGGFALLNLLSHLLLGWIGDLVNKARLLTVCMLAPALTVPVLIWGEALLPLWLFTVFFTLLDSSFPILWATVGDFFGRKSFATIRGTMSFFYMWGSVVGPVLAGAIYDRSQSYEVMLWGLFGLLGMAVLLNALLIKPWAETQQQRFAPSC